MRRAVYQCRGITLVELIVSMVILTTVAGIGAQSFILVLRSDREMESRSQAMRATQFTLDQLRRDLGNLIPAKVAGLEPFSEAVSPVHGTAAYRLLTRLPERYSREEAPGQAQALLVEYSLVPAEETEEDGFRLVYSRQAVGSAGLLGEPLEGTLAGHLALFRLAAVAGDDEGGGGGDEEESAAVPRAINVTMQFHLPDLEEQFTLQLPVPVKADKKDKDSSDTAAQPPAGS